MKRIIIHKANIFQLIRFFFIRLLAGKTIIVINVRKGQIITDVNKPQFIVISSDVNFKHE